MLIKKFAVESHKVKALVYGASGTGKTTFAGEAKNAIFASAENGLLSIASKSPNYVEIKQLKDLKDLLQFLSTQEHGYETVIIDSITEINDVIKADIEKRTGRAMQLQDWGTLAKEIKGIFKGFRDLPMHVLFIAQETSEKDSDVVIKIVPSLNGKASTEIAYFMDIVGYISIDKKGERKIITSSNERYLSKDRSNVIGDEAPVSFQAWIDRVAKMKLGTSETVADFQGTTVATPTAPKPITANNIYATAKKNIDGVKTAEGARKTLEGIAKSDKITEEERTELTALYQAKLIDLEEAETVPPATEAVAKTVKKLNGDTDGDAKLAGALAKN